MEAVEKPSFPPYLILFLGVISFSFAAILIRLSTAPSIIIAFYRLFLSVVILLPYVLLKHRQELRALTRGHIVFSLLSGFFLALHFYSWIASLEHTSVTNSVVLVSIHPILVALIAALFFGEVLNRSMVLGVIVAILGSGLVGAGGLSLESGSTLRGDLLALLGAVMMAGYIIIGSRLRKTLSIFPYVLITYGSASLYLLIFILFNQVSMVGYPGIDYLYFLLLALGPTVFGHTSFNWALKYLPSSHVSVSYLGEPVGSSFLALLIFQEAPPPVALLGGIMVLSGLYLTIRRGGRRSTQAS